MKNVFLSLFACVAFSGIILAQNTPGFTYTAHRLNTPIGAKIVFDELPALPEAHILLKKALPAPLNAVQQAKVQLDEQRRNHLKAASLHKKSGAALPIVGRNFNANVTNGTPNDNDFAIGNNGMIISCVNTNILMLNDTGRALIQRSLSAFGNALGPLNRTYDPLLIDLLLSIYKVPLVWIPELLWLFLKQMIQLKDGIYIKYQEILLVIAVGVIILLFH
jgi:hypothetical protein